MKKRHDLRRLDIFFALALLLKIFSAGFTYFPILDDYIQYGSYPMFDLSHVYFNIGTISIRPFASILDPLVWGAFWPHMALVLLLISALYFLSALFLDRCLIEMDTRITPFLYGIYLLLPLTFEGTYWISASSRIVVGMFFATTAAFCLAKYFTTRKKVFLLPYVPFCLLSFGFYESVMIFSGVMQLGVVWHFLKKDKNRKYLSFLAIPGMCAFLMMIYYGLAKDIGALGSRTQNFSLENLGNRIVSFVSQFLYIFSAGLIRTTIMGFFDGCKRLIASPFWGMIIFASVVAISLFCAHSSKKHKTRAKSARFCVSFGLLLTFLPLLPNLLVEEVWLTYRSVFVCLPGICLMLAPLFLKLFRNRYARMIAVFLMVFVFSVGCINEVATYKTVNDLDQALLSKVAGELDEEVLKGEKTAILVLPRDITPDQTSFYKDHVKSVFYTDWALTGALRAVMQNNNIKSVNPVLSLDGLNTEGQQIIYMDQNLDITEAPNEQ